MNTAQMPPSPNHDLDSIPEFVEGLFRQGSVPVAHAPLLKSNLLETWQSFWLQIAVPGIDVETLRVQAIGRRVYLAGRFKAQVIDTATYVRQELPIGEMTEVFELPDDVDGQRAEAHVDGGVLTVRLPKLSHVQAATIPVCSP